jgi:hypothetical protein
VYSSLPSSGSVASESYEGLAAEAQSSKKGNKPRALDLGYEIDRQRALRRQKQRSSEEEAPKKKKKSQPSQPPSFLLLMEEDSETKAAQTHLYPVYIVTPSWDKDDESAQKRQGNRLLNPTYEEAHAAEPFECPQMSWEAVVTLFANQSEIGSDKLYDPYVRPIALVAGGRLTVRRRRYKSGSQPDRGYIRVVADERFGYDARAAYVEARMRKWRNAMHARTQRPDALGYVDARPDDAALQPQTAEAALDHFHRQYSEVSDRQITREIHAEIVGSSSTSRRAR